MWVRPWWRHQMETFSALLAICAENSPVPGEFPAQRPVTRSFDVFFDLRPNKRLSKQSWGWWSETPSSSLWRHRNAKRTFHVRLYEHFRDIQNLDLTKPLGRHCTLPNCTLDVNHITSHILAFITKPSNTNAAQQMRLKFERDWIYRLGTNLPHGLNAMDRRCLSCPYPLPYSTFLTPCPWVW